MTLLQMIAGAAQQVAEAISAVLGVETEIVDDEYNIVAGTGKYREWIGRKDREYELTDSPYIYGRVLRTGETYIIEDPSCDFYGPELIGELGEICCPVRLEGRNIGVMALVAFDENQRYRLLSQKEELVRFLRHMADLLASRIAENIIRQELGLANRRLNALLEAMSYGVLAVDSRGIITNCNQVAAEILNLKRDRLLGRQFRDFISGLNLSGMVDREAVIKVGRREIRIFANVTPIEENSAGGAIIVFRPFQDIRRIAYRYAVVQHDISLNEIIGRCRAMQELKKKIVKIASSNSTVLITGESGTGKELIARAIHNLSPRREKPFVIINCGAIPDNLLESELFGYEEGAFTGARRGGRIGKFELAQGGTIFLDEVAELPLHLQVKLLHVLQRRQIERLGGDRVIPIDVRIIAATNRDLEQMCRRGEFRLDLYYRLNVIPLAVPPLRERKEDIPVLVEHFCNKYSRLLGKNINGVDPQVLDWLQAYWWPGNVRELENVIEYAVNMAEEELLQSEHLPERFKQVRERKVSRVNVLPRDVNGVKEQEIEIWQEELRKLKASGGRMSDLARKHGISRATLYRRLKKLGLVGTREEL